MSDAEAIDFNDPFTGQPRKAVPIFGYGIGETKAITAVRVLPTGGYPLRMADEPTGVPVPTSSADRLSEALAVLEKCRPIVEADARMQDDILGHGVMEYGSEAEASVARAVNRGWELLARIDAVLGKEG